MKFAAYERRVSESTRERRRIESVSLGSKGDDVQLSPLLSTVNIKTVRKWNASGRLT